MLINLRFIDGSTIKVEASPTSTVSSLSDLIRNKRQHSGKYMFIYKGKTLKDDTTIESLKLAEGDFIVVHIPTSHKHRLPNSEDEGIPHNPSQPSIQPLPDITREGMFPLDFNEDVEIDENSINSLVELGFTRSECETALRHTGGRVDLAAALLTNPDNFSEEFNLDHSNSEITQMITRLHNENPEVLRRILAELDPNIASLYEQNPNVILQALQAQGTPTELSENETDQNEQLEETGDSGLVPGVETENELELTQEDESSIQRLQELGFDRMTVLQVYFACNKDENLSANCLLAIK
ncbi:UBA/TS-N domain containing protein [Histomonas meleagridis]|uniref:UBA/TS-N domain containing protein n=1 Tax=Histomonas meleagridis TaxID=135588 RepID=UPI00355AB940|nr:UBA/TS-N domain containing protein [Histomonas meleagridis]KAH0805187.1 UBA/TS-N domain containing protein [Histomonas meleagridis]